MVIALLTDFGTSDYFVGAVKGTILSINENAQIVDITHDIPAQNLPAASFILRACYKDFPPETIFVAVVDPGVGSPRKAILAAADGYYFIAPDNGLLSFIFDEAANFKVFELTNKRFFAAEISRTFHGRDVFAPVAAHVSKGIELREFGAEIKNFVRLSSREPRKISEREIEAEIIHTDCFGNLVTNLKASDLPEEYTLEINGQTIEKKSVFFAEADQSELLLIVGSAGFLEIVAFQDSAKEILSVAIGEKVRLSNK